MSARCAGRSKPVQTHSCPLNLHLPHLPLTQAHDSDVNVVSWNGLVTYMMASGADDGSIRIWDLRSFSQVRE